LPDAAREVIFPKGVPFTQVPDTAAVPAAARARETTEETSAATKAEGDLLSESSDIRAQPGQGVVPEAAENLLKWR
jgi:hypothetical protein